MVRFMPPPLARLVTLALQTRVHQDGLAPAAVGVSTPVAVMPSDLVGLPTAYRMTQRAAALDPYEPGEQSPLRRALSEFRKAVRPNRRPKGKAYVLFEFDFRARNLALTTPEAVKEASLKWKRMGEEERAPWVTKARNEPQPLEGVEPLRDEVAQEDFVDELAGDPAYMFFLFDYRATHVGLTRAEASMQAGSKWKSMTDTEKAPFFELAARERFPPTEPPAPKDDFAEEERYIQQNAKAFLIDARATNVGMSPEDSLRLAAARWRGMSSEERAIWDKTAVPAMAASKEEQ